MRSHRERSSHNWFLKCSIFPPGNKEKKRIRELVTRAKAQNSMSTVGSAECPVFYTDTIVCSSKGEWEMIANGKLLQTVQLPIKELNVVDLVLSSQCKVA